MTNQHATLFEAPVSNGRPASSPVAGSVGAWVMNALVLVLCLFPAHAGSLRAEPLLMPAALYPNDMRRLMTSEDYRRFPGAGILYCRDADNVPRKAAASWLIGSRSTVLMNAHNFRDRQGDVTRTIEDCFFQIGGENYAFDPKSLLLGVPPDSKPLHITDDWALARLTHPAEAGVAPQPLPRAPTLPTGGGIVKVTMVSPAGHANFIGVSSLENCAIHEIDPPSEDDIRRVRHDCNDGFGGSGSGLFDESGNLIAMQSASLDMNRRMAFDIGAHYGSALLIEGRLLDAIKAASEEPH